MHGVEKCENDEEGDRNRCGQSDVPEQGVRDSGAGSRSHLCDPAWTWAWFRRAPRPPGRARAAGSGRGCPSRCLRAPHRAASLSSRRRRYGRSRGAEGPPGAGAAVMAAGSRVLPLAVLALLPLAAAVYEDQVGKFDW